MDKFGRKVCCTSASLTFVSKNSNMILAVACEGPDGPHTHAQGGHMLQTVQRAGPRCVAGQYLY